MAVILVTGASSGFGRLTAQAPARAGHTVVAGIRATEGRNAPAVAELDRLAKAARRIKSGRPRTRSCTAGSVARSTSGSPL
ncbi:SDR family NAD(P)-dependent oxidoreductase [Paractinoplanes lichenicola]|uniref:SDR family NAD(P)-dependent oxidoreductase n=1 Tax=Paractinoplanes lichenicola TaxID=2802976 RepID=A0ABS1W0E4_9ACTN|nr:SDR family NAD(P)-dependent oxidoreductase [Actinoplanes lichenicola]MBL7260184.1 SDR family NAD(P)-dependent oxidoreductase [Actinoplanes lichenicola]